MLNQFPKSALQSRGVWGGAAAVVGGLGGVLGYSISPQDVAQLPVLITSITSSIGGLLAIYGRIKATHKIG